MPGDRRERRLELGPEQLLQEPAQPSSATAPATVSCAAQQADVGERGVRAVEQPQLDRLVRARRRARAARPPASQAGRAPAKASSITHWRNGSADDGRLVAGADQAARPPRGRRPWWRARCGRPSCSGSRRGRSIQLRAARRRGSARGSRAPAAQHLAVAGEVVAGDDGQRRVAPAAAARSAIPRASWPTARARRAAREVGRPRSRGVQPAGGAAAGSPSRSRSA